MQRLQALIIDWGDAYQATHVNFGSGLGRSSCVFGHWKVHLSRQSVRLPRKPEGNGKIQ